MSTSRSSAYPVLPLKDVVVFPHMVIPLFDGRDKSVAALEKGATKDSDLGMVTPLQMLGDTTAEVAVKSELPSLELPSLSILQELSKTNKSC